MIKVYKYRLTSMNSCLDSVCVVIMNLTTVNIIIIYMHTYTCGYRWMYMVVCIYAHAGI